jgi:tetratricopeptide (TPR) repeat protein
VSDESRIEALRTRLHHDPASIAFAQLAEEYRRAGRFEEAIEVCRAGLARHPGYLSARVTLGRALFEVGEVESAYQELADVTRVAPENLSAVRALAEVRRRQGEFPEALEQFKAAFEKASPDPMIDQIVRDLRREADAPREPAARRQPAAPADVSLSVLPHGAGSGAASRPPVSAAAQTVRGEDSRAARRAVAYLERWLEAIVADRRSRLYGASA